MASSSRVKQERNSATDVHFARNRLDGVLQTLVEKAEDSTEPSDEDSVAAEVTQKELPSSSLTPSKRGFGGRTPRKRRRKDDNSGRDLNNGNFSYVMKLFDRSVDLAKFNEETPLYPICRAWMYNEPYNGNLKVREPSPIPEEDPETANEDEEQDESKRDVDHLPEPLRIPKRENHFGRDHRVPSPLPSNVEKLDIHTNPDDAPEKNALLVLNMQRWKTVRQRFKEVALANEARYKESLAIIKSLKVVYE